MKKTFAEELGNYRNLSGNVWDQHGEVNCYPHASANVETRGESVFAALNAIDGVLDLVKTGEAQYFNIKKKGIEWLELSEMIKADDSSPFPALTQLQVYGRG